MSEDRTTQPLSLLQSINLLTPIARGNCPTTLGCPETEAVGVLIRFAESQVTACRASPGTEIQAAEMPTRQKMADAASSILEAYSTSGEVARLLLARRANDSPHDHLIIQSILNAVHLLHTRKP